MYPQTMANPRRATYSSTQIPIADPVMQFQPETLLNSLKIFLNKPHALPFMLFIFLILTWVSLRFQHRYSDIDFRQSSLYGARDQGGGFVKYSDASVVKFASSSSHVMKDRRGWLLNPVSLALDSGIQGGATSCVAVHVGEIRGGGVRGNHRHHSCNETFVIWGAKTLFRVENKSVAKGYSEVVVGADEVAIATSPKGSAHALVNIDAVRRTFFLGCQDSSMANQNTSSTDFNIWRDL